VCASFYDPFDHISFNPMKSKAEAGEKLDEYVYNVGVMGNLHTDGAKDKHDRL
jgi:hypothetical protein